MSKNGLSVISIGNSESRVLKDNDGQNRMVHSLGYCNYLKIESTNHILFANQFYDDR